jgi:hypothetical protein
MDLIFEEGKVAGPKPLYLFPVPLLERKSEIDSFMKSRADCILGTAEHFMAAAGT